MKKIIYGLYRNESEAVFVRLEPLADSEHCDNWQLFKESGGSWVRIHTFKKDTRFQAEYAATKLLVGDNVDIYIRRLSPGWVGAETIKGIVVVWSDPEEV